MSTIIFETSDLALAAFLSLNGYSVEGITNNSDKKATFQFVDDSKRPGIVMKFFNRKARVEPIAFLDHVKSLKSMINQN